MPDQTFGRGGKGSDVNAGAILKSYVPPMLCQCLGFASRLPRSSASFSWSAGQVLPPLSF